MRNPSEETEFLILLVTGVSIAASLAIFIIFFALLYQRKLNKHKMALQMLENEYRRKLLVANIETQENERNRIAKDLHDDVGAMLSTTKMFLGLLQNSPNVGEVVKKIEDLLSSATHKLRTISHNITPKNLESFGIVRAIDDIRLKLNETNMLAIDFQYNDAARFHVPQELNLYRIVQELLNNTMKHAEATEVFMKLEVTGENINFYYQDNGKGVDIEALKKRDKLSLGISNLESRADALNTRINLKSAPLQGFRAQISFKPEPFEKNSL